MAEERAHRLERLQEAHHLGPTSCREEEREHVVDSGELGRLGCGLLCGCNVRRKETKRRGKQHDTHDAICSWVCAHCWLEAANMAAMAEASSVSADAGTTMLMGSCTEARHGTAKEGEGRKGAG